MNEPTPEWQTLLREATEETNDENLRIKLEAVESAIYKRMLELDASSNGLGEKNAIRDGCKELLRLRTERLNWPAIDFKRPNEDQDTRRT